MSAHTPGPWRAIKGGIVTSNDCQIAHIGSFHDSELVPFSADRWNADTKLIAAAPDLAEALHELVQCSPCRNGCAPDDMTCATNKARAALAKAGL